VSPETEPASRPVLFVDIPTGAPGAAMRVAGMSVLERILRGRARDGYSEAVIRGEPADVPRLVDLPMAVTVVEPGTPRPPGSESIAGDVLMGVTIDRPSVARRVEWALLQTCRRPYDGPGDRYVIRSMSLRVTRALSRFPITPNQVTIAAMIIGLLACLLLATSGAAGIALAGALIVAQVVLDSVDGELARVRHMGSKLGAWLDGVSDDVIDNLLVVAMGIGIGGGWGWLAVVAAVGRGFSAFVAQMGAAAVGRAGDVMAFRWWFESDAASPEEAYDQPVSPMTVVRSLGRRDSYMLVYGVSCLIGLPEVAFALMIANGFAYTALAVIHLVVRRGRF